MKAYKIFDNNWTCQNFQYEVGKKYTTYELIKMCYTGYHACTRAIDCIRYYPAVQWMRYAEVELSGEIIKSNHDSKICASEIEIICELSFDEFITVIENQSKATEFSYGTYNPKGAFNCVGDIKCLGISVWRN